jgi:hypothetical protein
MPAKPAGIEENTVPPGFAGFSDLPGRAEN